MSENAGYPSGKLDSAVRKTGIWLVGPTSQSGSAFGYLMHLQYIEGIQPTVQKRPARPLLYPRSGLDQSFYRGCREGDLQPPPGGFSFSELVRERLKQGAAITHPVPVRPYGTS